eukprot:TRINITY_DN3342_c0_g1_i1.p2 TRINITY_DN3342_c0_g1~~TRINITY_DN3342_c0_g1_i1.p2  ORF type:complete len:206 (+),score=94.14 TRINITY_DN3342_c0_g1_i1:55-618(+)
MAAVLVAEPIEPPLQPGARNPLTEEPAAPRADLPAHFDTAFRSPQYSHLGVREGRLAPLPRLRKNCCSSYVPLADTDRHVDPYPLLVHPDLARSRIKGILLTYPRTEVVEELQCYLHAVCRSRLWHFKDDVEFFFDVRAGLIHVRAARRIGIHDDGANRDRVADILARYAALRPVDDALEANVVTLG